MRRALWAMLVTMVILSGVGPASAQWVHSAWEWKCVGATSTTQHSYWVTQTDNPASPRIQAKRITVHGNLSGEGRTTVCENNDQCVWVIEERGTGCRRSCAMADVVLANDAVLRTEEQCAK